MGGSLTGVWVFGKVIAEDGVEVLVDSLMDSIVSNTLETIETSLASPFLHLKGLTSMLSSPEQFAVVSNTSDPAVYHPLITWYLKEQCDLRISTEISAFFSAGVLGHFAGARCPNQTLDNTPGYDLSKELNYELSYIKDPSETNTRHYLMPDDRIFSNFTSIIEINEDPNKSKPTTVYEPRGRSWFVGAKFSTQSPDSPKLFYTQPYQCFASAQQCITGAMAVISQQTQELLNVVEFDISVKSLQDILKKAAITSEAGGLFIVNEESDSPNNTNVANYSGGGHNDNVINVIVDRLLKNNSNPPEDGRVSYVDVDGSSYHVAMRTIRPTYNGDVVGVLQQSTVVTEPPRLMNWKLVIFLPRSYFFGRIDKWNQISLLVFMSILIFAIVGIMAATTFGLILPVRRLMAAMDEVARINFESEKVECINQRRGIIVQEVIKMNQRFGVMVGFLREWITYLPEPVAARFSINENPLSITLTNDLENADSHAMLRKLRDVGSLRKKNGTIMCADLDLATAPSDDFAVESQDLVSMLLLKAKLSGGVALSVMAGRVIITWNTQKPHMQHAEAACRCALAAKTALKTKRWTSFVIASSQLWVGNLGTENHRAPVVYGDAMLQAVVLTSLTKILQVAILATDKVHDQVVSIISCRPVDAVALPVANSSSLTVTNVYEISEVGMAPNVKNLYCSAFASLRMLQLEKSRDSFVRYLKLMHTADKQGIRLLKNTMHLYAEANAGVQFPHQYHRKCPTWDDIETRAKREQLPQEIKNIIQQQEGAAEDEVQPKRQQELMYASLSSVGSKHLSSAVNSTVAETRDALKVPASFLHNNRKYRRSNKILGRGAYGTVWQAMGNDGVLVALKSIKLPAPDAIDVKVREEANENSSASSFGVTPDQPMSDYRKQVQNILQEVDLLSAVQHDNVVSYITSNVVDGFLFIAMEYVSGGNLATVLNSFRLKNSGLPDASVRRYITDVLHGLAHLHEADIIHLDVKPENILLSSDGVCKLADFGSAIRVECANNVEQGRPLGTPLYMAPEACRRTPCKASDVWSLGVTLCQLVSGELPWKDLADHPPERIMYLLSLEDNPVLPNTPPAVHVTGCTKFVNLCLEREATKRPTPSDLLCDPFVLRA